MSSSPYRSVVVLSWAVLSLAAAPACNGGGGEAAAPGPSPAADAPPQPKAAEPAKPAAAQPAAAPAAAQGPAPSSVDDAAFTLRMAEAGPYKAGELARFVLELQSKGDFHVNQEYPIEVNVTAAGDVMLPKAQLTRPDAAEFTKTKARFDIPFTAKAEGPLSVNANVKFAVCTDENCVPDERNLTLALAIH